MSAFLSSSPSFLDETQLASKGQLMTRSDQPPPEEIRTMNTLADTDTATVRRLHGSTAG